MIDLGWLAANWLLIPVILALNLGLTILVTRYALGLMVPQLNQVIHAGLSAMGVKSGDVRAEKAMEKAIAGDLLNQYPEVITLLEQFSPETADMIRKNPQMALNLIQRYKPLIDKFLPGILGDSDKKTEWQL